MSQAITLCSAKETTIFFLDAVYGESKPRFMTLKNGTQKPMSPRREVIDFTIEAESLYDFIMKSVDETTSPRGVEARLHIRHNEEDNAFEIWSWGVGGNHPKFTGIQSEIEEEMQQCLFQMIYDFDFLQDDQRDTCYYGSMEEAEAAMAERLQDM